MTTEENSNNKLPSSSPAASSPATTSCRKKKSEEAIFLEDVKDRIDEFFHASMDDHKTCFQNTIKKMFGLSKAVADKNLESAKGVESSNIFRLHLRGRVGDINIK